MAPATSAWSDAVPHSFEPETSVIPCESRLLWALVIFFALSVIHFTSHDASVIRAWRTSSTGFEADIESPPGYWWPPRAGGAWDPVVFCTKKPPEPGWVHLGDVHFFQDHLSPPYPTSYIPAMGRNGFTLTKFKSKCFSWKCCAWPHMQPIFNNL